MLKSWKTRALATAGAVALAAPFTFMGGALAATPPTSLNVSSPSGTFTAGSQITVSGNCALVNSAPQTAIIRLRGPADPPTVTDPVVASATPTVSNTFFQGNLTLPAGARVGDNFAVTALCVDNQGLQSTETVAAMVRVEMGSILTGSGTTGSTSGVTGVLSTGTGGVTGTGLTSTSGATTATSAGTSSTGSTGVTTSTTGSTTGATPIPRQPNFTG